MMTPSAQVGVIGPQPQAVGNPGEATVMGEFAENDRFVGRLPRQIGGFRRTNQAVTREQLLEQGISSSQANALVVRQHQEEVLMRHFRCWILVFGMIICLATPTMVGLLIWLIIANVKYSGIDCDAPLQMWVRVVLCIVFYNSTINRPSPHGSCVQRTLCGWTRDPNNPRPMPLRVCLYQLVVIGFAFVWNCAGLHWISIDGQGTELPACKAAAPMLYEAVKVYAACNLAITLFMYVNMLGLAQVLRLALRRGLLRTNNAAPSGSLDKNTEAVGISDVAIVEEGSSSCSICLEDFDSATPMVKTKVCKHIFHKQCLKGWLQVNRTCPLCREDLGRPPPIAQAWEPPGAR